MGVKAQTYGIMVYAIDTAKWLMIQRRHSIGLLILLKGRFVISHIPSIVSTLTQNEMDMLHLMLKSKDDYIKIFKKVYVDVNNKNVDCTWDLLDSARELIYKSLHKYRGKNNSLEWLWAKGHPKTLLIGDRLVEEDAEETAVRELIEESGISITSQPHIISTDYVEYERLGIMGEIYMTRCLVCAIFREIDLPPVTANEIEVNDRRWMSTGEVESILCDIELKAFRQSQSITNNLLKAVPAWNDTFC